MVRLDRQNLIFMGIFAAFFGFLLITGDPVYTGDTLVYENPAALRDPAYALLLWIFRSISPHAYGRLLIAFQNILAAVVSTACVVLMRRRFSLRAGGVLLLTAALLAPHILIPVFTDTRLVLTNVLMPEGLLLSLYPLGILCLADAVWAMEPLGNKSFCALAFFLLLSLIRARMTALFAVWYIAMGAVVFVNDCKRKRVSGKGRAPHTIQQLLLLGIVLLMVVVARVQLVRAYNYY